MLFSPAGKFGGGAVPSGSGHGIFLYPAGDVYIGQWVEAKPRHGGNETTSAPVNGNPASGATSERRKKEAPFRRRALPLAACSVYSSSSGESAGSPRRPRAPSGFGSFESRAPHRGRAPTLLEVAAPCRSGWGIHLKGFERYEGEWQDDLRHGRGCVTSPTGERYVGQFVAGAQNGRGISIAGNGYLLADVWDAGQLASRRPFLEQKQRRRRHRSVYDCGDDDDDTGGSTDSLGGSGSTADGGDEGDDAGGSGIGGSDRKPRAGIQAPPGSPASAQPQSLPSSPSRPVQLARRDIQRSTKASHEAQESRLYGRSSIRWMDAWTEEEVTQLLSKLGFDAGVISRLRVHRIDGAALATLANKDAAAFLQSVFTAEAPSALDPSPTTSQSSCSKLLVVAVQLFLKVRHKVFTRRITGDALRERFQGGEVQHSAIAFEEIVGEGSFGRVHRAKWMHAEVAAKTFWARPDDAGMLCRDFVAELQALRALRHPNITCFMGFCLGPQTILLTSFVHGDSLFDVLHRRSKHQRSWSFSDVKEVAREVSLGMVYLHSHDVVHCDLKSSNILVGLSEVKICDFGLTRLLGAHGALEGSSFINIGCVGTHPWIAPEVLRGEAYAKAADVYSFGMILWEMIARKVPFSGYSPAQVIGVVGYGRRRPRIPRSCPEVLRLVLKKALRLRPVRRKSFAELSEDLANLQRSALLDVEESLWEFFGG